MDKATMNNQNSANIAVVGAGLAGRFIALLLSRHNRVTLYEKSQMQNAKATGRIAAAMVAPVSESVIASPHVVAMGLQSTQLWQPMLSALGVKAGYHQNGSIILAHRQDLADLRHFIKRIKSPGSVKALSAAELQELEPELGNDFSESFFLPIEGHLENRCLYDELNAQINSSSIHLVEDAEVNICGNQVMIYDKSETYDQVIDCRGMGAKNQLAMPLQSLRGVRGEVIRLHAPGVKLNRPIRLMHPRYPIYIVPKAHNQYIIGATEIESEDYRPVTVRSGLELLSAAYSVHKGFAEAEILSVETGLRPTLSDNEPCIAVNQQQIQINGLYRHGFLLAPYIVAQTLALLSQQGIKAPAFSQAPVDIDNQLVKIV